MNPNGDPTPGLSPDDQRLLDDLVEAGFEPDALGSGAEADRQRAVKIKQLLDLMNDYPVEDGDETLEHATMARIDRFEEEQAARMSFDAREGGAKIRSGRSLIRLPDFISVAAVLLIAAGILWPVMSQLRNRSIDLSCSNNLRQVGYAFSQYADDYGNTMPMARAGVGQTWDTLSNVINLRPLIAEGYCERGHLNCPGVHEHDHADATYSYQWHKPGERTFWGKGPGTTLVLGDRNPLIDAFHAGRATTALTTSTNHGGRGQNVLGTDGTTMWLERPVIGSGDNIWLPKGLSALRKGAEPSGQRDVFLAH